MSYFFRNVWHMPAWRAHSMGSFPPPSLYPFSAPVTLGRTSPCPIGDGRAWIPAHRHWGRWLPILAFTDPHLCGWAERDTQWVHRTDKGKIHAPLSSQGIGRLRGGHSWMEW